MQTVHRNWPAGDEDLVAAAGRSGIMEREVMTFIVRFSASGRGGFYVSDESGA